MKNIKVAIGIILKNDTVLLARRVSGSFKEGFWEFAGGKVEVGETSVQALVRECKEELDIEVLETTFLRKFVHKYSEKTVSLDTFIIAKYSGEPTSNEGQELAWVEVQNVTHYNILPTVMPLLNFATLSNMYWITPDEKYSPEWFANIEQHINSGITLLQLRIKRYIPQEIIKKIYQLCQKNNVKLMLNSSISLESDVQHLCHGVHLTSVQLGNAQTKQYPFMSASTHDLKEAMKAETLGFDFIVISPVRATQSHPEVKPIGFDKASEIAKSVNIPVYFLGGMSRDILQQATSLGAQGIAGISLI